ncbi:RagB/SusD family nutrient uptake outer membrane protein [Chitinophaga agrisoli]|uniref:RagB/SusD family nutrient uptake outer membrane protein n=1 Tax=Chitinophaga agrisoli TaxID=2607653 RepID=A0A5B2W523_9BACT|nr:RagB/SusD family nutrient uptake outer membrane protein [Chitinophaga agrisoli]KAA2245742.1 RagB/SusD family nutrient uptake outer membrane protein [Chitinophaga agrisoli]
MKRLYIFITILAFTAVSCKKSFIDLSPQDQISGANLYKTEPLLRQALIGAYTPLRDLMVNDFYTGEMRSDNTHYEFYQVDRGTAYVQRENIADFTDDPTNAYTNAVYFHCYNGITRANLVLENMGQAPLSDTAANDIAGQAEFIRAFNYFKLVRYFGGVPLFLKSIRKADDAFLPRSTADEVYAQIIKDAQDAVAKLSDPVFAANKQGGQATKGAATMLLAEVYMTQKKYAEAATLLTSLDAMGYDLLTDYAAVFSPANKNSRESIFEVQYLEGLQGNQFSDFIYRFLPRSLDTKIITGVKSNNRTIGGWNTPTQDMIATYEPDDKRLDASIGIAEGAYDASFQFTFSANKSVLNYTPAAGKVGVPYIKKYLHTHANPLNTDDNWPIYRYADALLMLAEALNEQGNGGAALASLNRVRARAFGDGAHNITTTAQAVLRDIIAHERRVELAFENHRWHDLVRTGKAIEVMNADGIRLKQIYPYLSPASYQVNANKLLFPIPQSERDLNPALAQNPGYPQ